MPACSSDNLTRVCSMSSTTSRSNSASPPPSSPMSTSPLSGSPLSTLKRSPSSISSSSYASSFSSTPTVIFNQHQSSNLRLQRDAAQLLSRQDQSLPSRLLSWYIDLLLNFLRGVHSTVSYIFLAPALWASAWVCAFWLILQLPLAILKWFITVLHTPASERARNKKCVLISGGSTVQAVHLAQNFYKAGAKVVVCDLEDLFALARFSTACSKYYSVPKPGPRTSSEYIKALKDIVQKEKATYYIPVSATSTAYYDALAKPHLEALGCECFIPSTVEVTALDDPLELLRRCRAIGLPTPNHFVLRSLEDVNRLYERDIFRHGRYMMIPAGPAGMRDRTKVVLPSSAREFRRQGFEINDSRPWLVIREPGNQHFVTCTVLNKSRVVANVTCRVDQNRGLIPEERADVSQWLEQFFTYNFRGNMSGHLSFRLALSQTGELFSIGCRVGIGLPYICYTSVHPRLVWRPCRHFSRQNSGVVLNNNEVSPDSLASSIKRCNLQTDRNWMGTVLDKKEALFVYWDPLPYCAYYYLQLPFRRVAQAIRSQQHNPPLAVVQ